ncbi:hypothetical protein CDEST_10092 [Colletotrichum destructivum]|uniref:Uncharacterized protein n=1 Tax=Colletotrichum destructivum TaxID=34406 RepID=A0AAX4IPY2_9PEZI|nr:hypothetical protein CDEST_10092 [Colletotrichum destructivum]
MGLRQNPIPRAKGILRRLWPRVPGLPRLGVMEQPRTKQFVMFTVEGMPDTPKCMTIMFWPILKQVPMRVVSRRGRRGSKRWVGVLVS